MTLISEKNDNRQIDFIDKSQDEVLISYVVTSHKAYGSTPV